MRMRFTALAAAALAAATVLSGCGGSSGTDAGSGGDGGSGKPFKVIAFTSGNQTPIGAWWVKQVQADAKANGWDLTMIQGDFDFQKMNPQVESAIGQGADAIFDGYTDVASISSIVTAAKDSDIPIFAVDAGTEANDAFALNVTSNQQGIADQTVQEISKQLGGLQGKNVMVIGHDPHPGIRMRASLAEAELKKAGANIAGGSIQKVKSPATGRTEALALVSDYLTANPGGLDAVWVGWDDAALGAAQGVSESGSKAIVTGCDASSEAIAAIQSGTSPLVATVEQPWPSVNKTVEDAILAYQKDGTKPSETFDAVDTTLVTKDNAASITPSDKLGS
ncbi:ribose transport system substrate-binding protein [Quadrisphaera granulorum]|uniref:Ribose transport system substrate-binding protein n=1 Tax=Quadrisphaera granulorum TaxID=317664 RepID=A0A316ABJ3_9ACTN|nr:sugar ABC transporter substrate-binding protein [Quadrisphaera granulorum]PWJ54400.1 ribose transport system substrate-binding protein [Quadrisphaera granulorum]SZE96172.1 ribose transport system substrate-binding protein [Quadrisphaera granulorum]